MCAEGRREWGDGGGGGGGGGVLMLPDFRARQLWVYCNLYDRGTLKRHLKATRAETLLMVTLVKITNACLANVSVASQ